MATDISLALVDRVRVASPCHVRWEEMNLTADERVRRCARCDLNVHNISEMTREEAEGLLRARLGEDGCGERRVCGVIYQRADGTVIFKDCPVGLARARAAVRRSIARALAMIGVTSVVSATMAWATRHGWDPRRYGSFGTVSEWIGGSAAVQTLSQTAYVRTAGSVAFTTSPPAPVATAQIVTTPPTPPGSNSGRIEVVYTRSGVQAVQRPAPPAPESKP